jgi:hypothetical protein
LRQLGDFRRCHSRFDFSKEIACRASPPPLRCPAPLRSRHGAAATFRLFTKAEGAEGHCEGMAPTVFWDAAYNWLDTVLNQRDAAYQ